MAASNWSSRRSGPFQVWPYADLVQHRITLTRTPAAQPCSYLHLPAAISLTTVGGIADLGRRTRLSEHYARF